MYWLAAVVLILSTVFFISGINILAIVNSFGYHRTQYNQAPGSCKVVSEIEHGSEDITFIKDGKVLISSGSKSLDKSDNILKRSVKGQIFLFDLERPDKKAQSFEIHNFDRKNLAPLGTSIWIGKDDTFVYITNLRPNETTVEKFLLRLEDVTLVHKKTIRDAHFALVNGLVAVGLDQFYFTNSQSLYGQWQWLIMLELMLRLPWATVGYYDGVIGRTVVDKLSIPNGITISNNKKFVYVSQLGREDILVFERKSNNDLKHIQTYPVHTMADNLKVDPETGHLWIGAHPIGHKLIQYEADPYVYPSPSLVLLLRVEEGIIQSTTQVYSNDGSQLSGSSVAYPYKGGMLAGSVFRNPIYCYLKSMV